MNQLLSGACAGGWHHDRTTDGRNPGGGRRLRTATPCRDAWYRRLPSAMDRKANLTLVALFLLMACRGPEADQRRDNGHQDEAPRPARLTRDLTLPTQTYAGTEITTRTELAPSNPARRAARSGRPQRRRHPTLQPTESSSRRDSLTPAPAPRTVSLSHGTAAVNQGQATVLEPGQTVTVLPASSGTATVGSDEVPEPEARRGSIFVGRGGGTCHPGRGTHPAYH